MSAQNLLSPPDVNKQQLSYWHLPSPAASTLALSHFACRCQGPLLILTKNNQEAEQLQAELHFYQGKPPLPILLFPDREVLPYDYFSPHEDLISTRLATLVQLQQLAKGIVIAPLSSLSQYLPPRQHLQGQAIQIATGDRIQLNEWLEQLTAVGYRRVDNVISHGEFAVRGSIMDIFPSGSDQPIRIDYFDDEIDSLRYFDPETQLSTETVKTITLLPAYEYPLDKNGIQQFRQAWREQFSGNPTESPVYNSISQGQTIAGIEFYLPLFYDKLETFFDYLPANSTLVSLIDLKQQLEIEQKQLNHRYEQLRYNSERPLLATQQLYLSEHDFFTQLKNYPRIQISEQAHKHSDSFACQPLTDISIDHRSQSPNKKLQSFLQHKKLPVLFCAESLGRREVLTELLQRIGLRLKNYEHFHHFLAEKQSGIMVSPIQAGYIDEHNQFIVIGEADLFGEKATTHKKTNKSTRDPETIIRSLAELNIGDPVVHITHGIGRYQGLKRLTTEHSDSEFAVISYADDDIVYIPIDRLDSLSRYVTNELAHAPLHRLGSKQWQSQKQKALKKIRDVAAELLKIYSERAAKPGFAFSKPDTDTQRFRAAFPFSETADQTQAIDSVIEDMSTARAMDRLVCGDVGFGKTEVAMQAAFLATQSHKQVIVLVPTTILAKQHTQSFQNRFADFPVKIRGLTRFSTGSEQQEIFDEIAAGKIDIIIGTHKLLNPTIKYKDLGLLIIDEEHRFGVKQKEQIKALRAHVDILTLTATPIPRTLNMAFSGVRDLSIIASPPEKRLSVKTFLRNKSDTLLEEAISRELMRGGQVYFLHNDIATIEQTANHLAQLVPQARIASCHGKTPKSQLERIMLDFYHQKINILVSTTIIESGIDVPTANTIIIDRSDKLGMAQLHQLRGRVGRSHHQAYAYLLVPEIKSLKTDAKTRLEAIAALDSLGAGFNLASQDLEIRGAGELLGEEQSGHIEAIGFTLFMDMLNQAVEALKAGKTIDVFEPKADIEIELRISALIPDRFIPDINMRLSLYQQLSECKNSTAIDQFSSQMVDRFGLLPEEAKQLIQVAKLKLQAKAMRIHKIEASRQQIKIHFDEKPKVAFEKLIDLIQKRSDTYQLLKGTTLCVKISSSEAQEKIALVEQTLEKIRLPDNK